MNAVCRPELMIFDCDGVLVDSERLAVEVESRVLREMGWDLSADEVVRRFVGRSSEFMLSEVERRLGAERTVEFDNVTTDEIVDAFRTRLRAIDGVEHLIRALSGAGVATCVASSGSYRKMDLTLGVTQLGDLFDGRIYSASEVENGKPAPDLFLHAAGQMGFAPEACAVIEDSVHGVAAAVAAGMVCYGFAGGLTSAEVLEGAGAISFDTMDELRHRLLDTPTP